MHSDAEDCVRFESDVSYDIALSLPIYERPKDTTSQVWAPKLEERFTTCTEFMIWWS